MAAMASAEEPLILGPVSQRLAAADWQAITALVTGAEHRAPVMMIADASDVIPQTWFADAYLPALNESPKLRRGVIRTAICDIAAPINFDLSRSTSDKCSGWRLDPMVKAYAQVAERGRSFVKGLSILNARDRPFEVEGPFTDAELISLITFVRSGPTCTTSWRHHGGEEGDCWSIKSVSPVVFVRRVSKDSVSVRSTNEIWHLRRRGSSWILVGGSLPGVR